MKTRKFFVLSLALAVLVAGTVGIGWALEADYNRPNPLMDYAPQEVGIYDTRYDEYNLDETELSDPGSDCRACHGNSVADRHHYTDIVVQYRRCNDCHTIDPSEPSGVTVTRNCTTPDCHVWPQQIGPLTATGGDGSSNGWHHFSELSFSLECTGCHDRNLIGEVPAQIYQGGQDPPSIATPSPFSCDNCHWSQDLVDADPAFDPNINPALTTDEDKAGHPSTFNHFNQWGQPIGYYQYDKIIYQNDYTHHMGGIANFSAQCGLCHGHNPNTSPDWDPNNWELIRYCEHCHTPATLHSANDVFSEHVGEYEDHLTETNPTAVKGWEAVGWHAGGGSDVPVVYRGFKSNEQCFGCHGDNIEDPAPLTTNVKPNIGSMTPMAVCPEGQIEIYGTNFGEEAYVGSRVEIKEGVDWISVPIQSWTDTRIVINVQGWVFSQGTHKIRVWVDLYDVGFKNSTTQKIVIKDCDSPVAITPIASYCQSKQTDNTELTNPNAQFGTSQLSLVAPIPPETVKTGVYRTLTVNAGGQEYIPTKIKKWGNTVVKFQFKDFFVDADGDWLQDDTNTASGTTQDGDAEPKISKCADMALGYYNVSLKYIFFLDSGNVPDQYDDGDVIYQEESSSPQVFELANKPWIRTIRPRDGAKRFAILKIIGENFGNENLNGIEDRARVKMGRKNQAKSTVVGLGKDLPVKEWTMTRIKVRNKARGGWVGSTRYIWIETIGDGGTWEKSGNYRAIDILP